MQIKKIIPLLLVLAFASACTTTSQLQKTPVHYTNEVSFTGEYHAFKDVDVKPRPTVMNPPIYPKHWLDLKIEGFATVHWIVGLDGNPGQVQCSNASDKLFAESAIKSIKGNRYKVAILDGNPVPCLVKQKIKMTPGR